MKPLFRSSVANLVASVQRADARSEASQVELLRHSEGTIRKVAAGMCPSDSLREDALQSARLGFLVAIRRFDLGRAVKLDTYAWPYMVKQIQRDVLDANHSRFVVTEPSLLQRSLGGSKLDERLDVDQVLYREQRFRVQAHLSHAELALLEMAYLDDIPQRAIAEALGVSAMTVNRSLAKIRARAQQAALAA